MAVRMRLMRMGKTKSPVYRVVVMDGRAPRDGRYIDQIGRYDPRQDPSVVEIDTEKAVDWLRKGAQPSDPVRKLLEISGAWARYKVATGKVHTVAAKTPPSPQPTAEQASAASEAAATEAAATEAADTEAAAAEGAAETGPEEAAGGAGAAEPTAEQATADEDGGDEAAEEAEES